MKQETTETFTTIIDSMSKLLVDRKCSKEFTSRHAYFDSVIRYVPSNPQASSIELAGVANRHVRIFAGRATAMEYNIKQEEFPDVLESVVEVVRAIIDGSFIETVWISGDKVTRYYSEFRLQGKVITSRDCNVFAYLLLRPKKYIYNYAPW